MSVLVADVGGTNARLAMVRDGIPTAIKRYDNDSHSSFYEVLQAYRDSIDSPPVEACCVAVAGPVNADHARLTNRDWDFDVDDLRSVLGGPKHVRLTNDLVALGYALPHLRAEQLDEIRPVPGPAANDQALVAGAGTGFNACLLKGTTVVEAELGHVSLPVSVADVLRAELGGAAERFETNEDLFSGRGLARLHQAISGTQMSGPQILEQFAQSPGGCEAQRTVLLSARLLGILTREMVLQYLPLAGIHFAGGAARGILGSSAVSTFLAAFEQDGVLADQVARVPIRLIADDAAALIGAAHFVTSGKKG
ncbi:glucokinase [Ruegeria sp. 2205SS24-7]|uniref:glucokinase n=1 Tax=Ruegeria discodermiae TaxID=3064389 RepID=UPI0027414BC8|nr:glucokinase [Ruegeria sp. 2205SS24-7]MDP5218658.1 glucokinase [Ruegeria sp. 2205SS24-7]